MKVTKVKSFTLSEMLVVMVITAIVVGIAFTVLNLVVKQIKGIEKNFQKATELSLFEQRLWRDFNTHNSLKYTSSGLYMFSSLDTTRYHFHKDYIVRNTDTIHVRIQVSNAYYMGKAVSSGYIDALALSGGQELPGHSIFVFSVNDAAHFMNKTDNN